MSDPDPHPSDLEITSPEASGELPPLVQVDAIGNVTGVDFAGALEHIPDQVILPNERESAATQLRRRVAQVLAERAAQDLADEILGVTSPEPDAVETAGGETIDLPPGIRKPPLEVPEEAAAPPAPALP